jgi:hypothetical protein
VGAYGVRGEDGQFSGGVDMGFEEDEEFEYFVDEERDKNQDAWNDEGYGYGREINLFGVNGGAGDRGGRVRMGVDVGKLLGEVDMLGGPVKAKGTSGMGGRW